MEVRTAIIDVVAEAGEVVTLTVPSLFMTKLHSSIIACVMTSFFAPHEGGVQSHPIRSLRQRRSQILR